MIRRATGWAVVLLLVVLAGCATASETRVAADTPGPALVVERFLQAANASDLESMLQLFGSAKATISELDGRSKAEQRMHVLATLLRHDDFVIRSQAAVPGRLGQASQVKVQLTQGEETPLVPFTVVRRDGGGWIIEQIGLEPLTKQ